MGRKRVRAGEDLLGRMFGDPNTVLIPVALPTAGTVALSVVLHALPTGGQSEYKH